MPQYKDSLDNLLRALGQGLDPDTAFSFLGGLDQQRQERRDRRLEAQQSQQGFLSNLTGTAIGAAQEGTSLEDLMRTLQATTAASGVDPSVLQTPQVSSILDSLYLTNQGPAGNFGQSRINPSIPPEDAAEIMAAARAGKTPDEIHAHAQTVYGPKTYGRLAPEIDKLIQDAGGTAGVSSVTSPF